MKVEDAGGFNGTTPLSSTAQVTVNVVNINDNPPLLNNGGVYGATVNKTTAIGTVVVNIECTDNDLSPFGNSTITSHDFSSSVPFSLTGSGGDWVVSVSQNLAAILTLCLTYRTSRAPTREDDLSLVKCFCSYQTSVLQYSLKLCTLGHCQRVQRSV